jgi:hypothetical protein
VQGKALIESAGSWHCFFLADCIGPTQWRASVWKGQCWRVQYVKVYVGTLHEGNCLVLATKEREADYVVDISNWKLMFVFT